MTTELPRVLRWELFVPNGITEWRYAVKVNGEEVWAGDFRAFSTPEVQGHIQALRGFWLSGAMDRDCESHPWLHRHDYKQWDVVQRAWTCKCGRRQ